MKLRLLIILNFLISAAFAQIEFQPMSGPPGGDVDKVEISSDNKLYALSNDMLYRSTNSGGSWTLIFDTGGMSVADFFIDNADKIYIVASGHVWSTPDDGLNWTTTVTNGTFEPQRKISKNPHTGHLYVIGNTNKLLKSIDDGLNWTAVYSIDQVNDYTIGSASNQIFIAANSNGVVRSTNDGGSWSSPANNLLFGGSPTKMTTNSFNGRVYVIMHGTGVFQTVDGGENWVFVSNASGATFSNQSLYGVFASKSSADMYFYDFSNIYHDDNPADLFTTLPNLIQAQPHHILSKDGVTYVSYDSEGIRSTGNNGASWSTINSGINHVRANGFLYTTNGALLVSNGGQFIRRSIDGGDTWNTINACNNCSIASFVQLTNGDILGIGNTVSRSVDNGASFTLEYNNSEFLSRAVRLDDNNIYALSSSLNKVFYTANQGSTWTELNISGTNYPALAANRHIDNLAVLSNNDLILSVYNQSNGQFGVFKVASGTTTATQLTVPDFTQYRAADAVGTTIAINGRNSSNSSAIAVSNNGGASWTTVESEEANDFRVITDEIFFGRNSDDVIMFTNDAGVSWTNLTLADGDQDPQNNQPVVSYNQRYLIDVFLTNNDFAYVGVSNSSFYRSSAGIARPDPINNLAVIGTGSNPIILEWETTNGNEVSYYVWRKAAAESEFTSIASLDGANRYYADNTTQPSTSYQYYITAYNSAGERSSDVVDVTTKAECASTIPDNRSWTATDGGASPNTAVVIRKVNESTYSVSDLTGGFRDAVITDVVSGYFFQNCTEPFMYSEGNFPSGTDNNVFLPNGNGTWNGTNTITLKWQGDPTFLPTPTSATRTITLTLNPTDPTPTAPSNLFGYVLEDNKIKLEWTPGNFNATYEVERASNVGFTAGVTTVTSSPISTPYFVDNFAFSNATTYFYRVKALNTTSVASPYSSVKSITYAKPAFIAATSVSNIAANGASMAWGDIDNDGDEDILVPGFNFGGVGEQPATYIFENNGAGDFISRNDRIPAHNTLGNSLGDINNDGQLDVVMCIFQSGTGGKVLYQNTGNFSFTNIPNTALTNINSDNISPAGWADVDNDADLDLLVIAGSVNLFLNDGTGQLTAATSTGNPMLQDVTDFIEFAFADYDKDNDQDVLLLADIGPLKLYKNDGSGIFTLANVTSFAAENANFRTASWGDYDNDLDLDVFLGVESGQGRLFRNEGGDAFTKLGTAAGPTEAGSFSSYGSSWGDVDNDGDIDLMAARAGAGNAFYINQGNGTWVKSTSNEMALSLALFNTGISFADYDKNGALDVMTGHFIFSGEEGTPAPAPTNLTLFKNNIASLPNYLLVRLIGTISNKQAVGARVEVITTTPARSQMRHVSTHTGLGGQNGQFLHFGLGAATTATVKVYWPSGIIQTITGQAANNFITITEDGTGPTIGTRVPAIGAMAAPTKPILTIELAEFSTTAIAGKKVNVYLASNTTTPVLSIDMSQFTKTAGTGGDRYAYSFTNAEKLLLSTDYTISIDAGAFEDSWGNDFLALAPGTWNFKTSPPPALSSLSPAHNATNVAANTTLALTFGEPVVGVAGKTVKVFKSTDAVNAVATVNATSAVMTGNTATLSITPILERSTIYNVVVEAGAFTDLESNDYGGIASGSWTFTSDGGPLATSLAPAHNATNVAANTTLALTFGEPVTAAAGKTIRVYRSTDAVNPVATVNATSAIIAGNTATLSITPKLQRATVYNVVVDAGAFIDAESNSYAGISSGSWTFTSDAGPSATTLAPAHNATNVAANTTLAITFAEPVTGVAGKTVKVYKSTDAVNAVATVNATSAVISGNTATLSITPKLQRATVYNVVVESGAFVDAESNDHVGIASGAWTFTSDPGPTATTLLPAHNTNNVAINTNFEITFSSPVVAVAGKKIKVMDGSTAVIDLDVSTNGTISGNKYTLNPANDLANNIGYTVTVDAGAFTSTNGDEFVGIAAGNWLFTSIEAPDTEKPTINFTNPGTLAKGFGTQNAAATVTDNKTVSAVTVKIRKISGSTYTDLPATAGANNSWIVTLTESAHFDEMGAEFYIEATDLAGNLQRNPATGTHKIYLSLNAAQSAIPQAALGFGGTKTGWRIFSVPFELSTPANGIAAIFDELNSKTNKVDYRIIRYGGGTTWHEYPDNFTTITRGLGYFINIKETRAGIELPGNPSIPANDRSNLFSMTLAPGWNMIGNPYMNPVDWNDVRAFTGNSSSVGILVRYDGSYSNTNQVLNKFEGAFVNNTSQTSVTISIPFDGQTSSGGRIGADDFGSDLDSDRWIFNLNLSQQEFSNKFGSIGMSPDAKESIDAYDLVSLPRFFDYVEVNFAHPEYFQKRFTRDIVPTSNQRSWDFTVDSNLDGDATMTWDNNSIGNSSKDLFLLDISRQVLVNMKETGSYSFNTKESVNFRIYFGENLKIAPEKVHLGKAYPNPTKGETSVAFSLPESGGFNQSVTLEIIDGLGRVSGTVAKGLYNPGYYETSWNASELTNGFYTYRLTVQNRNGKTTSVNKLIIK